jgi:hypothetical protein
MDTSGLTAKLNPSELFSALSMVLLYIFYVEIVVA